MTEPRYIVIDSKTGEHVERCDKLPAQIQDELSRTLKQVGSLNGLITKMERDEETEARKHKLWAEAEAVHTWWRLATGHFESKFTAEDFYQVLPRLKERGRGPIGVLKAIAGAAYDPGSKTMKNGGQMVYDDWELINRSKAKADNFALRAPGRENSHDWKRWLLDRIESNLQGKEKK